MKKIITAIIITLVILAIIVISINTWVKATTKKQIIKDDRRLQTPTIF